MHTIRLLAAAAVLAGSTVAAQAQSAAGGYLAVGGGLSSWDVDCSGTSACDKTGSAARLSAGWRFGNGFALEAQYTNLGKTTARVNEFGGSINAEVKASMAGAGIAVFLPLGPAFEMSARLGLAQVSAKASGGFSGGPTFNLGDESKAKAYAGIGLGWNISPTVQLQAQYDSTRAEVLGDEGTVGAFTLGVAVRF